MKQVSTQGILLNRTNYGEADRILSFITRDQGKISVIAKGVRKAGAKLAGSIEPFSVSDLTIVEGRGEVGTLISARLIEHYGDIVKDIDRTHTAYDYLKLTNKATEARTEEAYFNLLREALMSLNRLEDVPEVTSLWFRMQLIKLAGHTPNLKTDESGDKLSERNLYNFDYDKMCFTLESKGEFNSGHIKFLRLGFEAKTPKIIQQIKNASEYAQQTNSLIDSVFRSFIRN
ncbi:MAG TPA: DNA repair protein RecO [Candidatus Saccharimonadales bacterium]|nr:DNA repair protein RecO [Candidatus Saccharimonadales bacterium]